MPAKRCYHQPDPQANAKGGHRGQQGHHVDDEENPLVLGDGLAQVVGRVVVEGAHRHAEDTCKVPALMTCRFLSKNYVIKCNQSK